MEDSNSDNTSLILRAGGMARQIKYIEKKGVNEGFTYGLEYYENTYICRSETHIVHQPYKHRFKVFNKKSIRK